MRVLRVLYELRPSGVEANLRATAGLWAAEGITIDILAIGPTIGPYAQALSDAGYRLHHLPLEPPHRFVPTYVRFLLRSDYDVVHVHPEKANFYVAVAARLLSSAVVIRSVHNVFAFAGSLGRQRRIQRAVLRRLGVTHVSIGTSVEAAEWRHFRNPTVRIYNAYDETRFGPPDYEARAGARKRLRASSDDFVIATVGNCSEVKNHTAVLRAVARLRDRLPVHYVHAGVEQAGHSERELASTLGVADRVTFLGSVRDVTEVLHAADCFVMPSRYEGLGNAALEALGCGLPCVLADVPGLRDLKEFFDPVWWVTPEADAVADALIDVAKLSGPASEKARATLVDAAQLHFSSRRAVAEYAQLYRRGLAHTPRPPRLRRLLRSLANLR